MTEPLPNPEQDDFLAELMKTLGLPADSAPAPVEADAVTRAAAQSAWNIYSAYVQVGFNEDQAMRILLLFMAQATMKSMFDQNEGGE